MTSKTFLDNGRQRALAVFLWQLRRAMPLTVLYTAVLLVFSAFPHYHYERANYMYLGVGALAMAFLLPALQYSGCFSRRQADLFHALPVNRGDFFWGSYLSGACCLLLPLFPAVGMKLSASLILYDFSVFWPTVRILLMLCLPAAATLALFTLAAVCSGNYLEYGVNSLLASLFWPALLTVFHNMVRQWIPGAQMSRLPTMSSNAVCAGSPPCALFFYSLPMNTYSSETPFWLILCWAVAGILLLAAGFSLYGGRRSEDAGNHGHMALQTVLRTLWGAAAALAVGILVSLFPMMPVLGTFLALAAMLAALGAVWVLSELFYCRGVKRLARHLPCLIGSLALTALLTGVVASGMGLDCNIPETAEVVEADVYIPDQPLSGQLAGFEAIRPGENYHEIGTPLVNAVIWSQEGIGQVRDLHRAWVQLEREKSFPYLPGRYNRVNDNINFYYLSKTGDYLIQNYSLPPGTSAGEVEAYTKAAMDISTSEEYCLGLFPLCAIDAADRIGKTTLPAYEGEWRGDSQEIYYSDDFSENFTNLVRIGSDPPENSLEISSMPRDFREKLEAALLEDFTHNRCPSYGDLESIYREGEPIEVYEIRYKSGSRITARGGVRENEPAQGQELIFRPALYDGDMFFRVWPEMTETYALLEVQYQ